MAGRMRTRLAVLMAGFAVVAATAIPALPAAADEIPTPTPDVTSAPVETPSPDPTPTEQPDPEATPVETPAPQPTDPVNPRIGENGGPPQPAMFPTGSVAVSNTTGAIVATASNLGSPTGWTWKWFRGATATTATTPATGTVANVTSKSTYTPVASDYGQFLRAQVTATYASVYDPTTKVSTASNWSLYATGSVPVDAAGGLKVGQTVSITPSTHLTITGPPPANAAVTSPSYGFVQWYRGTTAIGGATSFSYVLAAADIGQTVKAAFRVSKNGWVPLTTTSSVSATVKGTIHLTNPPTITENAVGLTSSQVPDSTTEPGATGTFQWLNGGVVIPGATTSHYLPTAADQFDLLSVRLTIKKPNYDDLVTTSVAADYSIYQGSGTLQVTGTAAVGNQLTVSQINYQRKNGSAQGVSRAYQWYRKTGSATPVAIPGATGFNYTLTQTDLNKGISVKVTASHLPLVPLTLDVVNLQPSLVAPGTMLGNVNVPSIARSGLFGNATTPLTLTATRAVGDITEPGAAITYQWMRNSTPIAGATALTYKPTAADYAANLWFRITATKAGYGIVSIVTPELDYSVRTVDIPTILGTPQVGMTLTAQSMAFTETPDGPIAVTPQYQWLRNGAAIGGATSPTYVLASADFNTKISVRITAPHAGYISYTGTSAQTSAIVKGQFTGTLAAGVALTGPQKLTATPSGLSTTVGSITYGYQWLRSGATIAGATAATYTLVAADYNTTTSVRITANELNFTSVNIPSAGTNWSVLSSTPLPTFFDTAIGVGQPLFVASPTYSLGDGSFGGATASFTWYRNGVVIADASPSSGKYDLVDADLGKKITVKVTATNGNYQPYIATSLPTQAIGASYFNGFDTAFGPVTQGPGTLTLTSGDTGIITPAVTTAYQWLREGATIPGATGATYTMVIADSGKHISVRATISKAGYTTVVKTSTGVDYTLHETGAFLSTNAYHWQVGATANFYGDTYTDKNGASVSPTSYSYQWLRNGAPIAGATHSSYTAVTADFNTNTTLRVTAGLAENVPVIFVASGIGGGTFHVETGIFSSGNSFATPTVDHSNTGLLTAVIAPDTITDPAPVYKYAWLRDGVTVAGTASTYQLVAADLNHPISLRVTVTKALFTNKVLTTTPAVDYSVVQGAAPVLTDLTSGGSTIGVGDDLTVALPAYSTLGASITPVVTYQWLKNNVVIAGATHAHYVVTSTDFGAKLSVKVTAPYPGSVTLTVTLPQTSAVVAGVITGDHGAPTVHESATRLLSVELAAGSVIIPSPTLSYKWFRGATQVATTATYQLTAADTDKAISVVVTASKLHATPAAWVLNPSTPIDYTIKACCGNPDIIDDGTPQAGEQLSAASANWTDALGNTLPVDIAYQWLRNGAAISGASDIQYFLESADVNTKISVRITATYPEFLPSVTTSAQVGPIGKGLLSGTFGPPTLTAGPTGIVTPSWTFSDVSVLEGYNAAYKWYRGTTLVATTQTYHLTALDYGKDIKLIVTISKPNYVNPLDITKATRDLAPVVKNFSLLPTAQATVQPHQPFVGQGIAVDFPGHYNDDNGNPITVDQSYQWFRKVGSAAAVAIPNATADVYTPVAADLNATLSVRVTAVASGFVSSVVTTTPSAAVLKGTFSGSHGQPVVAVTAGVLQVTVPLTVVSAPLPYTLTYSWLRDGVAMSPAVTTATYTPKAADWGHLISVKATAVAPGYNNQPLQESDQLDYSVIPSNSFGLFPGADQVGETYAVQLPAGFHTKDGNLASPIITYQWKRNGVAITGATAIAYTPVGADLNKPLTVTVTVSQPGYAPHVSTIDAGSPSAGYLGSPQAIVTPSATLPLKLSAAFGPGLLQPTATITYQWYRAASGDPASAITGATASTYTPVAADYGKYIGVAITATKPGFSTYATPVGGGMLNYSVSINGAPQLDNYQPDPGDIITATAPNWLVAGAPGSVDNVAWQWLRNNAVIAGATSATFHVTDADRGAILTARATASKVGYMPGTGFVSADAVTLSALSGAGAATLSITASTNTVSVSVVPGSIATPGVTYSYQWYRTSSSIPIAGATASTHKLVAGDWGQSLYVKVTASKALYYPVTFNSATHNYSINGGDSATTDGLGAVGSPQTLSAQSFYDIDVNFLTPTINGYQWLRDSAPIPGATAATYIPVIADIGTTLALRFTVSKPGFIGRQITTGGVVVTEGYLDGTFGVAVSVNSARLITATIQPDFVETPGATLSRQWMRDGVPIAGQTGLTYQLGTDPLDSTTKISFKVTASKTGYQSQSAETQEFEYAVRFIAGHLPAISDLSPQVNQTLTVNFAVSINGNPMVPSAADVVVNWKVGGVTVGHNVTYTVQAADFDLTITAEVTVAGHAYFDSPTVTSPATDPVAVP